ncbi:MAG TPA: hydantoinase/carbamoylase family amidase, partial [Burkholderiales bacterium]|nr:hydantoinase/carbamoylase family amidase [Burkholderiales bacterium]
MREPYGPGEQAAIDALADAGRPLALESETDPFGNLYLTLPGARRDLPRWIVGSHVDSVPRGGDFDGFAGVVAGVAAAAALRRAGIVPPRDVTVMAIRAEELSAWYGGDHGGHIGSRAALGLLPPAELDTAVNSRSGKPLREHMRAAGFAPEAVGTPYLDPARFRGYLELHIEQGPVLEARGLPVGVVTAIRGAARARSCRCLGAYTHSGAVPHEYRSDAVLATVELVRELDRHWERVRERGGDLVFTVGKLYTDAAAHAITKVPGESNFVLDFRSQDVAILTEAIELSRQLAAGIGARRRVEFELGPISLQRPAQMSADFRAALHQGSRELGIDALAMPSGAGHDAQDFVQAGIPAAMIFVRNANGSHNPLEAMDMADFALGTRLLTWTLACDAQVR